MDVASFLETFIRGCATGDRASAAAFTPGARRTAILTGFSIPIVLGTRSRKIIITIEPMMTLASHPNGPKASENTMPAVVARVTLARVPMRVVTLTSLVFSLVILSAVFALPSPSFCIEKRETCLTDRYVASTSADEKERAAATMRMM